MTATLAIVSLAGAALLGYGARLYEFKREHRRVAYVELVAAFIAATRAGTVLSSTHVQLGEQMFTPERGERTRPMWEDWRGSTLRFSASLAAVRLVGSEEGRGHADRFEAFIAENLLSAPPFDRTEGTDHWGPQAKEGPRQVGEEAERLAKVFTDSMRPEILRWRLPK